MPPQIVLAQVLLIILMFLGGVIGLSYVAKKLLFTAKPRLASPGDDSRLKRLEEGMDAIAVEIERISEAQRFTTKLLAARASEHGGTASE